jgi:hypothetical protein
MPVRAYDDHIRLLRLSASYDSFVRITYDCDNSHQDASLSNASRDSFQIVASQFVGRFLNPPGCLKRNIVAFCQRFKDLQKDQLCLKVPVLGDSMGQCLFVPPLL